MKKLLALSLFVLLSACSNGSNNNYSDHVEISYNLTSKDCITDVTKNAFVYEVRNTGNKTINKLMTSLIFYDTENNTLGKKEIPLIFADEEFKESLPDHRKVEGMPLLPNKQMKSGFNFIYLLLGEIGLRQKAKENWDDLKIVLEIKELETI